MDWWLLPLFLWLCVTQGASESTDERFYLRLAKNDDDTLDLTLQQCKKSECLRRGDHELGDIQCMCGDRYIEAERVRAECGDDGRNETAVEVLERQNLPEKLGICARAFAKLGYVVEAVKSNGSADDVRTYNDSELETKISEVTVFAREFWSLLDRTLVGVYLSSDQQRNICKVSIHLFYIIVKSVYPPFRMLTMSGCAPYPSPSILSMILKSSHASVSAQELFNSVPTTSPQSSRITRGMRSYMVDTLSLTVQVL